MEKFQTIAKQYDCKTARDLIDTLFYAFASAMGSYQYSNKTFVFKAIMNEEMTPEIIHEYPDAKIVYVLRNPLSHWCSYRNGIATKDESELIDIGRNTADDYVFNDYGYIGNWLTTMRMSYTLAEKYAASFPKNFYIFPYDKALKDPVSEISKLCEFLKIDFSDELFRATVAGKTVYGGSWYSSDIEGDYDTRPADFWKKHLSGVEKRFIVENFKDIIDDYGFERPKKWKSFSYARRLNNEKPGTYLRNRFFLKFVAPDRLGSK